MESRTKFYALLSFFLLFLSYCLSATVPLAPKRRNNIPKKREDSRPPQPASLPTFIPDNSSYGDAYRCSPAPGPTKAIPEPSKETYFKYSEVLETLFDDQDVRHAIIRFLRGGSTLSAELNNIQGFAEVEVGLIEMIENGFEKNGLDSLKKTVSGLVEDAQIRKRSKKALNYLRGMLEVFTQLNEKFPKGLGRKDMKNLLDLVKYEILPALPDYDMNGMGFYLENPETPMRGHSIFEASEHRGSFLEKYRKYKARGDC